MSQKARLGFEVQFSVSIKLHSYFYKVQLTSTDSLWSHVVTIEATIKKKPTTDLCELVDPELLEPSVVFLFYW